MATDKKITELDAAGALSGPDIAPIVQASTTVRTTLAAIAAYVRTVVIPVAQAEVTGLVAALATLTSNDSTLSSAISAVDAGAEHTANKNAASGYPGLTASKLNGAQQTYGSSANTACQGNDSRLSDSRTPTAHATSHKAGGSDVVKLDELDAPTDVLTLNVSTSAHGLIPKQPAVSTYQAFTNSGWAVIQEILTANRTYYVRTDGSDSNTGLVDSSGGAFLTIQKAIDVAITINTGAFDITIQLRTGTFAPCTIKSFQGNGRIIISGDLTTPSNVVISNSTAATHCITHNTSVRTYWKLEGVKLVNTGSGSSDGLSMFNSFIELGKMEFGACTRYCVNLNNATVQNTGNLTFSGNTQRGIFGQGCLASWNQSGSLTYTFSGTPAWSTAFCYAAGPCFLGFFSTMSGAATGKRYLAELNGVIQTFGGGANYFPGDVAGTIATGGQYN